jgi:hypothetical protein
MDEAVETKLKKLKNFNLIMVNLIMGFFHLIQGIVMLILSNDFTLPVTRGFLEYDPVNKSLIPTTATIIDLRIGPMVASFLFMSAIAHFLIATVLYEKYKDGLMKGMNKYRWYEYSASASIMIVIIAMLTGIYDIGTLMLIFFLNVMMILFGLRMEVHNQLTEKVDLMILFGLRMEVHNQLTEKVDWKPFYYGCIAGLIPWVVIAIQFYGAAQNEGGGPPDFVYAIYITLAILFNTFAINMVLQYKKWRKWKDYLYGERMYVILSLVAKSALAWQVFAGTLRPA